VALLCQFSFSEYEVGVCCCVWKNKTGALLLVVLVLAELLVPCTTRTRTRTTRTRAPAPQGHQWPPAALGLGPPNSQGPAGAGGPGLGP
jgi:hypothetical protein